MPQAAVDLLELVEPELNDGDLLFEALGLGQGDTQPIVEELPIGEAGEGIVIGQVVDRQLRLAAQLLVVRGDQHLAPQDQKPAAEGSQPHPPEGQVAAGNALLVAAHRRIEWFQRHLQADTGLHRQSHPGPSRVTFVATGAKIEGVHHPQVGVTCLGSNGAHLVGTGTKLLQSL